MRALKILALCGSILWANNAENISRCEPPRSWVAKISITSHLYANFSRSNFLGNKGITILHIRPHDNLRFSFVQFNGISVIQATHCISIRPIWGDVSSSLNSVNDIRATEGGNNLIINIYNHMLRPGFSMHGRSPAAVNKMHGEYQTFFYKFLATSGICHRSSFYLPETQPCPLGASIGVERLSRMVSVSCGGSPKLASGDPESDCGRGQNQIGQIDQSYIKKPLTGWAGFIASAGAIFVGLFGTLLLCRLDDLKIRMKREKHRADNGGD